MFSIAHSHKGSLHMAQRKLQQKHTKNEKIENMPQRNTNIARGFHQTGNGHYSITITLAYNHKGAYLKAQTVIHF